MIHGIIASTSIRGSSEVPSSPPPPPPPPPSGDPYFANVSYLGLIDEADAATAFPDYSSNALAVNTLGNTVATTSTAPAGASSSVFFDGSVDSLRINDNPLFALGSEDFTVEVFHHATSTALDVMIGQSDSPSNLGWYLAQNGSNIYFYYSVNGTTLVTLAFATALNTINNWHHIMASRVSNTLYVGIDGTILGTADMTGITIRDGTSRFCVGANNDAVSQYYTGYMSNARLTKGVGRYSGGSYTVPTLPMPTS